MVKIFEDPGRNLDPNDSWPSALRILIKILIKAIMKNLKDAWRSLKEHNAMNLARGKTWNAWSRVYVVTTIVHNLCVLLHNSEMNAFSENV